MKTCYKNLTSSALYNASRAEDFVNECKAEFEGIMNALRENIKDIHVYGNFVSFCPYIQHFRLDFLNKEDYPNQIANNSIYLDFKVDLVNGKVEVTNYGHIWLLPEEQKATYLAMVGLKSVAEARGVKWFRKQSYKDTQALVKKVVTFYKSLFKPLTDYTGGYPYKQGITWVKVA